MSTESAETNARPGDGIETRGVHGQAPRRGEIIEVLGREDTSITVCAGTSSASRSCTQPTA